MLWTISPFTFLLLSLSLAAAVTAGWFYVRLRRLLKGASSRSLTNLDLAVTELQSQFESLLAAHRRLHSRVAMREMREKRKAEPPDDEPTPPNGVDKEKLRDLARSRNLMR